MSELTSFAGRIRGMASSMRQLGIDTRHLETVGAAFQMVGGSGQVIKGLIGVYTAFNAVKAAEGAAHLAKYTVGAAVVAGLAVAGGVAMGMMIEKAISNDGAGLRALAGGYANGR